MRDDIDEDCVIVGGGPAGLSAALVLGRARRRVLLVDAGRPRNGDATAIHGVLGLDGIAPAELRRRGLEEVSRYGVRVLEEKASAVRAVAGGVVVELDSGPRLARTFVLATGVRDPLPGVLGLREIWGRSAHACPSCDGWEHRDQAIAVLGSGPQAGHLALLLRQWTASVVLLSDGPPGLDPAELAALGAGGVAVLSLGIARLESEEGQLRCAHFQDGHELHLDALFVAATPWPQTALALDAGCALREDGGVAVDEHGASSVDGFYAVGNCVDPHALVASANADGVRAAVAINRRLVEHASGRLRS